jgi:hypothetical protein
MEHLNLKSLAGLLFIAVACLACGSRALAQTPKYKEGERVEFDQLESSDPAKAKWVKATIIKVEVVKLSSTLTQTNYVVQVDPLPGQLPKTYTISARLAEQGMTYSGDPSKSIGWLRPLGGAAPKIESDRLRVDANGTVLADRPLLDCKNLKRGPVRNGQPISAELAAKVIRCWFEKPSEPGKDGATTMDITEIVPGTPRRWNPNDDWAMNATTNTVVYPFRVRWDLKSFYHTFNRVETGKENIFACFVDIDQWYCGQAQTIKNGEKRLIQVQK